MASKKINKAMETRPNSGSGKEPRKESNKKGLTKKILMILKKKVPNPSDDSDTDY